MNNRSLLNRTCALALVALLAPACSSSANGGDAAPDASPDGVTPDALTPEGGGPDAATVTCPPATATGPDVALTDRGAVRGTVQGATRAFLGIPYAAPPTGALRWRPPAPAACFEGVRDATAFGAACPQLDAAMNVTGAEDCLTLNVWTPATPPSTPLPVMFFIHGGANTAGSASQTLANGAHLYDGAYVAEHGPAVVVTINYRLGPLGFIGHPALTAESPQHASGNYGLLDQIAALHWVQANVAAFGGDPARVMVYGESAGGLDTCALLASPLSAGLFSRALIESGGCIASALTDIEAGGPMLATNAGCGSAADPVACLRELPADALVRALPGGTAVSLMNTAYTYRLAIDGYALTEAPSATLAAGRQHHMPVVIGTNEDEEAFFYTPLNNRGAMTDMEYRALVNAQFMVVGPTLLMLYPSAAFPSPYFAYVDMLSDAIFTCPARTAARSLGGTMTEPVRRYFFSHNEPGAAAAYGAAHAFELPYVFHNFGAAPDADQEALSQAMVGYWTRFAATGDPNGAGAPDWPVNTPAMDAYLHLDSTIAAETGLHTTRCDAWDRLIR